MPKGYSSHSDFMSTILDSANQRQLAIEKALRQAFSPFIENKQIEVIVFSNMEAKYLAQAIKNHPEVLKSILAACNIAARAIERDLQIKNLDTYAPKLNEEQAYILTGYIKPFLPPYLEIPTLTNLDRVAYIDKEIRKRKGRWELSILKSLNKFGKTSFKKRMFKVKDQEFELDAATPEKGPILIGVDIKRIEARRDIHKRCDEIVNKASKLKSLFPKSKFAAIIYYPFIDEHINIQNRLSSPNIDIVSFASESSDSIENAIRMLLSSLEVDRC